MVAFQYSVSFTVQQSDSAIYIHMSPLWISLPFRSPQSNGQSNLEVKDSLDTFPNIQANRKRVPWSHDLHKMQKTNTTVNHTVIKTVF